MGGAGAVLEAYKRRLERSLGRLGAALGALEAMLEPSGGQKAPKMNSSIRTGLKQFNIYYFLEKLISGCIVRGD